MRKIVNHYINTGERLINCKRGTKIDEKISEIIKPKEIKPKEIWIKVAKCHNHKSY